MENTFTLQFASYKDFKSLSKYPQYLTAIINKVITLYLEFN